MASISIHLMSHPRLLFIFIQTLIDSSIEMRCNIYCAYQSFMLPVLTSLTKKWMSQIFHLKVMGKIHWISFCYEEEEGPCVGFSWFSGWRNVSHPCSVSFPIEHSPEPLSFLLWTWTCLWLPPYKLNTYPLCACSSSQLTYFLWLPLDSSLNPFQILHIFKWCSPDWDKHAPCVWWQVYNGDLTFTSFCVAKTDKFLAYLWTKNQEWKIGILALDLLLS